MRKLLLLGTALVSFSIPSIAQAPWNGTSGPGPVPTSGDIHPRSIDSVIYCSRLVTIQACHNALPSTGGKIIAPPNTTIVTTAITLISKPNTTLECPNWGTILKRGFTAASSDQILQITGAGSSVLNCSFDGNAGNFSGTHGEVAIDGTNSVANHIQVTNYTSNIGISATGQNSRITGSTVTGTGDQRGGYGIWAITASTVTVDNNTVSSTFIDGIGVGGTGSRIYANHVFNSQCQTGVLGAQLAAYPGWYGIVISGNTVDTGCSAVSSGISLTGYGQEAIGNTVNSQNGNSLGVNVNDAVTGGDSFIGNTVRNGGLQNSGAPCLVVQSGGGKLVFNDNKCIDDQGTPTMTTGVLITSGSQDNITIVGNHFLGGITTPINDTSTGLHKIYANNEGIDDVIPTFACGNVLSTGVNPVVAVTGVSAVNFLNSVNGMRWTGRTFIMLPAAACVFNTGQNIANAFTATANVPITATYDGALWHLH